MKVRKPNSSSASVTETTQNFPNKVFGWWAAIVLLLVMGLALVLRLVWLDQAPKGALIDEAHFGYIAYSLVETGKDEHGVSWPIIFKGFGDQKLPAYGYALIPFVKLLGLSTFTIRIPSVIAGTLLVLGMYLVLRELNFNKTLSLLGGLFVAVNPWSFFLSRIGFESNLALGFFGFALWALLKMTRSKHWGWAVASAVLLGLTWYSYIAYRPITVGIAVIFLAVAFWQKSINWQKVGIFIVSLIVSVSLLFLPSAVGSNTTRFNQIGILSDGGLVNQINENRTFCDFKLPRLMCDVIWNKPVVISNTLLKRFIHTFSPQYLSTMGEDNLEFLSVKGYGQFYLVLYPFFVIGVLALLNVIKIDGLSLSDRVLIGSGLLLSPVPTILVSDAQKVRISALFPFVLILILLGIKLIWNLLPKAFLRHLFVFFLLGCMGVNTYAYMVNFWSVHTVKYDYYYQTYVPDLVDALKNYDSDTQIVIKPFFSDPLMFYAYYTKMDPAFYQQNAVLGEQEASGFQHTVGLANLRVEDASLQKIACDSQKANQHTVFATNVKDGDDYKQLIYSLNGAMTYVYIYDVQDYLAQHPQSCP